MTPADPVDAVVAAFRAEGMKGSRAQMERFARVAVETCVCPDCGGTGTRRVHSHEDYGVSFESETCESCPLGQAMLHAEALEEAVETCERDTVRGEDWARLLLERDEVQGRAALERMVEWYDHHDGRADDFGRLHVVVDAVRALEATENGERDG